jgi:hypothetical protein
MSGAQSIQISDQTWAWIRLEFEFEFEFILMLSSQAYVVNKNKR